MLTVTAVIYAPDGSRRQYADAVPPPTEPSLTNPRRIATALVLGLLLSGQLAAQQLQVPVPSPEQRKHMIARRATGPIRLDGRLDEPDWQHLPAASGFAKVRPTFAAQSVYETEVRILFTDDALFIGAYNRDSSGVLDELRLPDLRRDANPGDIDVFAVTLGPMGDGRTVFAMQVSPLGSLTDIQAFDGGASFSFSWDTRWQARTTRSDSGWIAEIEIPWSSIRYARGSTTWDINFTRNTRRALHWSAWMPFPAQFSSWRLDYAGVLDSIQPPPPSRNVRSRLYGLTESVRDGSVGPSYSTAGAVGGELIWAPTASSVFEATLNTDFAQADVDRQVVNLTRFSVFFPEQRQFFLENADLLSVGGVNLAGMNAPSVPFIVQPFFTRRIGLGGDGSPRPIDGGARYGYRSGRFAAGALAMRQGAIGNDIDAGWFGVARASGFIGQSTRIGGLVALRELDMEVFGGSRNIVSAVDAYSRLSPQTQVAAMLSTSATEAATGTAATYGVGYNTQNTALGFNGAYVSDDYAPSTGFVSRPDVLFSGGYAAYAFRPGARAPRVVWVRPMAVVNVYHDPGDRRFDEGTVALSTEVQRSTGAAIVPYLQRELQRPEATITVSGVPVGAGTHDYWRYGMDVRSDQSARLAVGAGVSLGEFFDGSLTRAGLVARWSPSPYVSARASYEVNRIESLGTADSSFTTHLAGPELRVFLNPRVQWSAFYQYNTAVEQGSLNARFSWEFAPLSYLFVVYNDRQPVLDGTAFRSRSLIVKLSWLHQL